MGLYFDMVVVMILGMVMIINIEKGSGGAWWSLGYAWFGYLTHQLGWDC
jgi:hypothetical protein